MKLNKYIFKKISDLDYLVDNTIPSEETIERWIIDWYRGSFNKVGCDGEVDDECEDVSRLPPMWLANWREHELD